MKLFHRRSSKQKSPPRFYDFGNLRSRNRPQRQRNQIPSYGSGQPQRQLRARYQGRTVAARLSYQLLRNRQFALQTRGKSSSQTPHAPSPNRQTLGRGEHGRHDHRRAFALSQRQKPRQMPNRSCKRQKPPRQARDTQTQRSRSRSQTRDETILIQI